MNSIKTTKTRATSQRLHCTTAFLILLIGSSATAFAEGGAPAANSQVSIRATHLLGFEGAKDNSTGTLTIAGDALQFQNTGKPATQVKIESIQDVSLGDQSKQVGGLPMTLGKAAVPFGGGRAVSLFAHKKYDTVTLEYQDAQGGFHGAIFELNKGQGEALKDELAAAKGARVTNNDHTKQSTAEVSSDNK
jgi:hypothetical protein